jgi:HAMP domain-containing protein
MADDISTVLEAQDELAKSGHGTLSRVLSGIFSRMHKEAKEHQSEIKRLQSRIDKPVYHYCVHGIRRYEAFLCSTCSSDPHADFEPTTEIGRLSKIIGELRDQLARSDAPVLPADESSTQHDDNWDDGDNDRPYIETRPTHIVAGYETIDEYVAAIERGEAK